MSLYITEWFCVACFAFFIAVSWFRPLTAHQRWTVFFSGVFNIAIVFASVACYYFFPGNLTTAIRNLVPAVLMVLAYWQSGLFYVRPNLKFQEKLWKMDQKIAAFISRYLQNPGLRKWIRNYLEFSYLLCYPMVPLGIAIFYFAGMKNQATQFWSTVLPPSFICYGTLAFLQTLPPRVLENGTLTGFPEQNGLRTLNMGIIQRASIQINTFPSAHAAASMAVALAVLHVLPTAGWILVCVAISIAIGAAVQRYHFAADVILGNAIAILWFLILKRI